MTDAASEKKLREQIKNLVRDYYKLVHEPIQHQNFEPGQTPVQYAGRVFDDREMLNLTDSMLDFWLTNGRFCQEFEKKFAAILGVRHCLLVNSGSSANLLAFYTLTSPQLGEARILPGDEVITVAAGFPTTVNPIIQYGAVPVFVDVTIDDGTYNIDVTRLEEALSTKTKAVMIAHTLGNPFDLEAVSNFCKRHKLWLVEDNCDALGSEYQGRKTGTFGDLATSSFYPAHHITMGEGGAVYTNQTSLKVIAESFRDWGRACWCASGRDNTCKKRFGWKLGDLPEGYDHKYIYSHFGFNLKATEMQAAIGVAQLDKLDEFTQKRRENFNFYHKELERLEEFFVLPNPTLNSNPSWFGFLLTVRESAPFNRDQLVRFLENHKIQTRMLFGGNLVRQPAFDDYRRAALGYRVVGPLTNADRIVGQTFWIGVYPGLSSAARTFVAEKMAEFVHSV